MLSLWLDFQKLKGQWTEIYYYDYQFSVWVTKCVRIAFLFLHPNVMTLGHLKYKIPSKKCQINYFSMLYRRIFIVTHFSLLCIWITALGLHFFFPGVLCCFNFFDPQSYHLYHLLCGILSPFSLEASVFMLHSELWYCHDLSF